MKRRHRRRKGVAGCSRELWWRGSVMASDMQHQDQDHAPEMKDKNCSYASRPSMGLMRNGGVV